jgi:rhodanese-related sulfurtransferase
MGTFFSKQLIVKCFLALFLLGGIYPSVVRSAEEGYPHRAEFPGVTYISTEDLAAEYDNVVIVDVRSKMEFDVVHILKALHLPVMETTFGNSLEGIRGKTSPQKIVFYCNGHTCKKSYEAVVQAMELGFQNVYAYDSGIFDWIAAHPDKAVLLGETPVAQENIIPDEAFKSKLLSVEEFTKRAYVPNALVIDIREPFQREVVPPLPQIRNIPLDRLIGILKEGDFKDKELLIFDAVGKQVNWLQYYLEANGIKNYFFLEKGVSSFEKK